ncbi:hypothetical protein [Occallatibacter riparius]|uniref:Uncharacterized protein n=1 Tax=Occallatibacter riparius TaxID=1002689 RepID=A0A9J7BYM0_9BACT|nr:hypothetical protein [Occallatibacter riparius]UWZ86414.1 hypothetical protein MOP44_10825 [Occallatibacter riparius]
MEVPRLCDRVRVRGERDEVFLVIKVDEEFRTVDLISAAGRAIALDAVPFSDIERSRGAET